MFIAFNFNLNVYIDGPTETRISRLEVILWFRLETKARDTRLCRLRSIAGHYKLIHGTKHA